MTLPGFMYDGSNTRGVKQVPMKVKASTAISPGDALKRTSAADTVEPATSAAKIVGIYNGPARSGSETDTPEYPCIVVDSFTYFKANVEDNNGGAVDATSLTRGAEIDLNSADGLDMGVSTNDDFIVEKVVNSTTVIGRFKNIED